MFSCVLVFLVVFLLSVNIWAVIEINNYQVRNMDDV